ncbi:hypothetical protein [Streptomyces californicus]|uniref:hypothetical protein n=1 Tax=Streptomyces californicus TaxID=67351 RepID=UPI0033F0FAFA
MLRGEAAELPQIVGSAPGDESAYLVEGGVPERCRLARVTLGHEQGGQLRPRDCTSPAVGVRVSVHRCAESARCSARVLSSEDWEIEEGMSRVPVVLRVVVVGTLDKALTELFASDYRQQLEAARQRLRSEH